MALKIEKMVVCDRCHREFTAENPGFFVQGKISTCESSTHYFETSGEPKIPLLNKTLLFSGNDGIDLCSSCLKMVLKLPEVNMYKQGYDSALREMREVSDRDRVSGGR